MVLHSYSDIGIRLFSLLFALIVTYMTYRTENKIMLNKKKYKNGGNRGTNVILGSRDHK